MITLAENSYGKSSVRLMKVKRDQPLHTVREWKVEVLLSGNFKSCFTDGDNGAISGPQYGAFTPTGSHYPHFTVRGRCENTIFPVCLI